MERSILVYGFEGLAPKLEACLVSVVKAPVAPEGQDAKILVASPIVEGVEATGGNENDLAAVYVDVLVVQLQLALARQDVVDLILLVGRAAQGVACFDGAVVDLNDVVSARDGMVKDHTGLVFLAEDQGLDLCDVYAKRG